MLHIPDLPLGRTVQEPRTRQGRPLRSPARCWPRSAGPTAASSSATCATPPGPALCCARSPSPTSCKMVKKAGELYAKAELPLGDGTQTPDQFVRMQSATTGLPEHMCRFNMKKNHFVLANMDKILDSLTRGLDLNILSRGYGVEAAACRSATRRNRRCWAWCCRAIRPACIRSGCRSSRCRSAWCSSRARRSRGRRTAWPRPSSRPACRSRRSPSIPAWATSARRCSHTARAA